MGDRPIDRLLTWGSGWGMLFGEPDHPMFGKPMVMVGPPDNWDEILNGGPLTTGEDDGIFEQVKQHRKERG